MNALVQIIVFCLLFQGLGGNAGMGGKAGVGGGPPPVGCSAVSDNFTRADNDSMGANWSNGSSGYNSTGITSNMAGARTNNGSQEASRWTGGTVVTNDVCSKATFSSVAASSLFVAVLSSTTNFRLYGGGYDNGIYLHSDKLYRLYHFENPCCGGNNVEQLCAGPDTATAGDIVEIDAKGTTITLKVNGATECSQTETTFTANRVPGIQLYGSGNTGYLSLWYGGDI